MLLQLPGLFRDLSNMFVAHPLRVVHRFAGLVLAVPPAPLIGTGFLLHPRPGWDEAYDGLAVTRPSRNPNGHPSSTP
jgi:hypothetical protein